MDTHDLAASPSATGQGARRGPDYAAFGIRLFRQLADAAPGENVIVSPLSAGLALSTLANGATGRTLAQILKALATGLELDALNQANVALAAALRTADVEMQVASSLWARGPFLPAYVERIVGLYGAQAGPLDSAGPINDWVSRSTAGRITEMVKDPIDPLIILMLLNAVYFKGRWEGEFDPASTRPRTFHAPSGPVERPMMSRNGTYSLLRSNGFEALRMPYRGGRFAMYVLLPDRGVDLARLRERLTAEEWDGWMGGLGAEHEVRVVMPSFRVSVAAGLNQPLQAMGMRDAFVSGRAELDGMLPAEYVAQVQPFVEAVLQKVFVEVNEEGTEAAASTLVVVAVRSTSWVPDFIVDRPFLLAIRDDQTGALLFIGQINDPVTE